MWWCFLKRLRKFKLQYQSISGEVLSPTARISLSICPFTCFLFYTSMDCGQILSPHTSRYQFFHWNKTLTWTLLKPVWEQFEPLIRIYIHLLPYWIVKVVWIYKFAHYIKCLAGVIEQIRYVYICDKSRLRVLWQFNRWEAARQDFTLQYLCGVSLPLPYSLAITEIVANYLPWTWMTTAAPQTKCIGSKPVSRSL